MSTEISYLNCQRCGAKCQVQSLPESNAKMLKRSQSKGLCVNCAVHDWLRNTYPVNMLLAQSGPKGLRFSHVQQQFANIMKVGGSDAEFGEINWDAIITNWDLPFPTKVKSRAENPLSQNDLNEIASGKRQGLGKYTSPKPGPLGGKTAITSFEQLNELNPGLGDKLKQCLREQKNEDI